MADDRPVDDVVDQLAKVTADLKDLKETLLARTSTRPVGDLEPTFRGAAKTGTVFCLGQTLLRADYPVLWQWVQDQGLTAVTNLFTVGDGSTTFGLPSLGGKVIVGVGTFGADTYALGAMVGEARHTLTTGEMPGHDHNVTGSGTNSAGSHSHGGTTGNSGNHGGHTTGTTNVVPPGSGVTLPASYNNFPGDHSHGFGTDTQGSHSHTVSITESTIGGSGAHENRQVSMALNWMIYY